MGMSFRRMDMHCLGNVMVIPANGLIQDCLVMYDSTGPNSGNDWENQALFDYTDRALPAQEEYLNPLLIDHTR